MFSKTFIVQLNANTKSDFAINFMTNCLIMMVTALPMGKKSRFASLHEVSGEQKKIVDRITDQININKLNLK